MSEDQITDVGPEALGGKKSLDPGFKRNIVIIMVTGLVAVASIAGVVLFAKSSVDSTGNRVAGTNIPSAQTVTGSKPIEITQADEERLNRVQITESNTAAENKVTYIPQDLPLKAQDTRAPVANESGPGKGYSYTTGQTNQQPSVDPQREANIRRGIENQLQAILSRAEPPPTQIAAAYVSPTQAEPTLVSASVASPDGSASGAPGASSADVLISGLSIAGARLVSPLDTSKSEFVSAVVTAGPLAGAYLVGKGKMFNDAGVQMVFTRMKFGEKDYAVNAVGLDNATSSDAMGADIDRKLLSRYVMPVLFSTFQAYLGAVAQVGQTAVVSPSGTTIVTPSAVGRQAAASGLAAGVGKAGETLGKAVPTAYMPIDTSMALLFMDPVLQKGKK